MFLKKYFPECYRYEEVPNYAEKNPKWKVFIKRIILFVIFLVLAFCINRLFRKPEPKPPVTDNFETHWQQLVDEQNEERRKNITAGINPDGTYVEIVSDLADLNLTSYRLNRYDCFCTNITNGVSHFVIQNGTLMGASTNKNGELGLGHCEPNYDARGYLRYEEIAENVRQLLSAIHLWCM